MGDRARASAKAALVCASSAYKAVGWEESWECLIAADKSRSAAMRALHALFRVHAVDKEEFDLVARASTRLRERLAELAVSMRERRTRWES
jgi:hypothetical protein